MTWLPRQPALVAALLVLFGTALRAQPAPLAAVVPEERLGTRSVALASAEDGTAGAVPPGVRLEVAASALTEGADERALASRLKAYGTMGISVWLAVGVPATPDGIEAWRAGLRRLLRDHTHLAVLEVNAGAADTAVGLYALRIAATEARSRAGLAPLLAVGGDLVSRERARATIRPEDLQPYADLLALEAAGDTAATTEWYRRAEPGGTVLLKGSPLTAAPDAAARQCSRHLAWSVGTAVRSQSVTGTEEALRACMTALRRAGPLFAGEISEVDAATVALSVTQEGRDVARRLPHRVLFDERTTSTLMALDLADAEAPVDVSLRVAVEGRPVATDLQTGASVPLSDVRRDAASAQVHVRVTAPGRLVVINFSEGASEVFTERTAITAAEQLTVEQIIARHQQRQNAEDQALRNYIADVRMSQHFRPTMTDPGYDIVTENRYYVDESGVEWEELSFSVNGSRWGVDRPPFPLLQPEKVLALPLQLRFGRDYRYELESTGRIDGVDCYVVAFEPARAGDQALYRGTVWIDRRTFAKVEVRTVQSGLAAPVVSNEETHRYRTVITPDGSPVSLLSSLSAQQILMIAGRNILLEKRVAFNSVRVNAPDFLDARREARASDRIMYRDTDAGVRYFVKEGGSRVVSTRQTMHAKALAMGTLLDPSYAFPLPIFGINYLDFEFGSPDTQFALLFGGVLAAGNIQRAKLGRTPLDGSLDFFGIAAPSTDRVFVRGEEREGERLLTWPLSAGANVGWQYTPYQKVTVQYQFRFDGFVGDRTTEESFRVTSSTTTHGVGLLWDLKRGGYSLQLNGAWYRRAQWDAWGATGVDEESGPAYAKYTASLSRDFYAAPFQKIHLNVAYFGGRRLDRFSRYQFGLFDDTRIHGVPASGIRFDRLGMVRGAYSFNLLEQYRFDVFLDQAWGRDESLGAAWRPLTGAGIALNVRAPWSTILRADIGKSFLPPDYRGRGSLTAQVMLLKPLH